MRYARTSPANCPPRLAQQRVSQRYRRLSATRNYATESFSRPTLKIASGAAPLFSSSIPAHAKSQNRCASHKLRPRLQEWPGSSFLGLPALRHHLARISGQRSTDLQSRYATGRRISSGKAATWLTEQGEQRAAAKRKTIVAYQARQEGPPHFKPFTSGSCYPHSLRTDTCFILLPVESLPPSSCLDTRPFAADRPTAWLPA